MLNKCNTSLKCGEIKTTASPPLLTLCERVSPSTGVGKLKYIHGKKEICVRPLEDPEGFV